MVLWYHHPARPWQFPVKSMILRANQAGFVDAARRTDRLREFLLLSARSCRRIRPTQTDKGTLMWRWLAGWGKASLLNWDIRIAALLTGAAVYFFSGYFTTVRFDRERIEVQANRGRIQVRGLYHYANTSRLPAVLTLEVPFPVDRDHPQPEWFALYESGEDGRAGEEIVPVVRGKDVSFRLIFRPGEAKWIRLDYVQPSHVSRGRYLLTTTRPWRRPIGRADYVLRLPRDFNLRSSNYAVSPAPASGAWQAFTFSKTDFFPEQDWEFAWHESRAQAAMHPGGRP